MKYTARQYAEALFDSLHGADEAKRAVALENFLRLVRRNRDYGRLNQIFRHYEKLFIERKGVVKVHIETPEGPSSELKRAVAAALGKPAVFSERANPALLAGAVIMLNDSIIVDASALTRIESLRSHI